MTSRIASSKPSFRLGFVLFSFSVAVRVCVSVCSLDIQRRIFAFPSRIFVRVRESGGEKLIPSFDCNIATILCMVSPPEAGNISRLLETKFRNKLRCSTSSFFESRHTTCGSFTRNYDDDVAEIFAGQALTPYDLEYLIERALPSLV